MTATANAPRLRVDGLRVDAGDRTLVRRVDLELRSGERAGLIGESGSGKSLTALAVMGLLGEDLSATGDVRLAGVPGNLLTTKESELARLRGARMSMVFQEPLSALNPLMRVGDQIAEVFRIHRTRPDRRSARAAAVELLDAVRLPDPAQAARAYPHQLSGGQRQRVMIAMALANDPDILICDEPTSALDVTVQAQILDLVSMATAERDTGLLFITHDLAVVATLCDRVLVMREGEIVETGAVRDVFSAPRHPYTKALLEASELGGTTPPTSSEARPDQAPVIAASGLTKVYRRPRTSLRAPRPEVRALHDVGLEIAPGRRFGIVGESGSGKSTLVRLIAGLDQPTDGSLTFSGRSIVGLPESRLRFLREELQMVFQDPMGSLDPRMRVRDIIAEPLVALGHSGIDDRVTELLSAVGLPSDAGGRYPHQFSGGQRQRISIARALAPRPSVLVADEPVSALDAPIRAQILGLLAHLVETYDLTLVLVSHDLTVIRHVCDTVAVLRQGRIVEQGPTAQVYAEPTHPYTRRLLAAVPTVAKALAGVTASGLASGQT
ncbi:MAG TPA: ABC transporter ATP-binding protein [Actinopolymorphaceae bacterium]